MFAASVDEGHLEYKVMLTPISIKLLQQNRIEDFGGFVISLSQY